MNHDNSLTKVGYEIEVVSWENNTYQDIADRLIEAEYLMDTPIGWETYHPYGCSCQEVCGKVRSGDIFYPPLVSITYDATLPTTGAEFVTSTVPVSELALRDIKRIWEIVGDTAIWSNGDVLDREGRPSMAGFHIHCSASLAAQRFQAGRRGGARMGSVADDINTLITLYSPELIALASVNNKTRGLRYRMPARYPEGEYMGHHGLAQLRVAAPQQVYVEWRLWEAEYDDWDYVLGATYISAAFTRAMLNRGNLSQLMAAAWTNPVDEEMLIDLAADNAVEEVINLVHPERLAILREMLLRELSEDEFGQRAVENMFQKVRT